VRSRRAVGALRRLALRLADLPSAAGAGSLAAGSAVEALDLDAAAVYIQRSAGRVTLLTREGRAPSRAAARLHRLAASIAIQQDARHLDQEAGLAAFPMRAAGKVVGALVGAGASIARLDEQGEALLVGIAAQAGAAVGPSVLNQQARARASAFQALHAMAVTTGTVRDPVELARLTVDHARQLLGVDSAALRWWDPDARALRLLAGIDSRDRQRPPTVESGQGVIGAAFKRQRLVIEQNYASARNVLPESHLSGTRAAMAVPLRVHDRCVGALSVNHYSPHRFLEHHGQILALLAAQAAPAIEAALLAQQEKLRAASLSALHEVAVAATGVLDQSLLARLVVDKATALLGADSAALAVWDDGSRELRVTADNHPAAGQRPAGRQGDQGCLGYAFRRRVPIAVDDYERWEHALSWPDPCTPRSALAVPLMVEDRVALGALGIRCATPRHFEPGEVQLLSLLAAQVAPALQAAHLFSELQASQARLSHVLSHAPVVLFALDMQGRITLAHGQASIASGITGASQVGRSIFELVKGPGLQGALRRALRGHKSHAIVTIDSIDFDLRCSPLYDAVGRPDGVIAVGVDLSERRRAEEALRESEAKSRFVATMSHELRTPLNSVLGYSQLLSAQTYGPLNDRQSRYLGHIETSGRHLLELIDDILDLSKIQAGHFQLSMERLRVEDVLEAASIKIGPMAREKDLRVEVVAEPGIELIGDRRRLEQIVLNLLTNAVKFTPAGGVITVASCSRAGTVELTVADTGPGIDPAHREVIFEEFRQLDSGFDRAQEGSGLGLALCRRLVEMMHGTIDVESRLGEGSVFRVRLQEAPRRTPSAAKPGKVTVPDSS
jgi:signal transduction histidine kinase